eukprot:CAMPEP_0170634924 /NCGR_PEP_ID=MMETSP0224-20130122/36915_1 /TAXON_ID=285029 /ORGANISM="Togula jolla, Strain CCCM 725" /LENGTH=164 /DNA_ID=CAMNT_0010964325 /DNA_START=313 /DNA_END=803 /DNA_ORIENTATION=+
MTNLLIVLLATRQLAVVFYALETHVVPAARDLCSMVGLSSGHIGIYRLMIHLFIVSDPSAELKDMDANCSADRQVLTPGDMMLVIASRPQFFTVSILGLFLILNTPQIVQCFFRCSKDEARMLSTEVHRPAKKAARGDVRKLRFQMSRRLESMRGKLTTLQDSV